MITDAQARKLYRLLHHGCTHEQAALQVGIDPKTARKYRRLGLLPSEVKRMDRDWRTRPDAFAQVWPELETLLQRNPGLQAKTLFGLLGAHAPGRYQPGQLRTFQRHVPETRSGDADDSPPARKSWRSPRMSRAPAGSSEMVSPPRKVLKLACGLYHSMTSARL